MMEFGTHPQPSADRLRGHDGVNLSKKNSLHDLWGRFQVLRVAKLAPAVQ